MNSVCRQDSVVRELLKVMITFRSKINLMRLIVLTGVSNVGKTSTLNILYNFHLTSSNGFSSIPGIKRPLGLDLKNDFLDVLRKRDIKIGFATMGDRPTRKIPQADRVCGIIKYFKENGCSIVVMACNKDNHDGMECIKNEDTDFISFERERTIGRTHQKIADRAANNAKMAKDIFDRLDEEISLLQ